ncbi:MAG: 23S rRNA (pseudouridine(1915)-N(3))-methyltransferase RlmH [Ruminococcaceae bacterium]|nr:23S rRNA (pseudouridine(1915)-N(3))-methyltransferase RlmH [Oscillospiraceae bacterium]
MVKCTLITLGALKEEYLSRAVEEYKKRISGFAEVTEINLKDEKLITESPAEVASALEAEADKILAKIPEGAYTVALCVEGKEHSSEAFAELIGAACDTQGKLCFIIGSSYGLSPRVKQKADARISFSKMTFPHGLMRAILTEQIYRAFTILKGKKYHK